MIRRLVLRPFRSRQARRRLGSSFALAVCLVGTLVQQTRAVELWPWLKQPSAPDFRATAWERVGDRTHRVGRSVADWIEGMFGPPLRAGGGDPPAGAPKAWQAADPVGPFSVVNLANGNLFCQVPIVSWEGVSFSLYYNTQDAPEVEALSEGWSHTYAARLEGVDAQAPETVTYVAGDGTVIDFEGDFSAGVLNSIYRITLQEGTSEWTITDAGGNVMEFDGDGALEAIVDSSGNTTSLDYNTDGTLHMVKGPGTNGGADPQILERELVFSYDNGKLASVTAPPFFDFSGQDLPRVFPFSYTTGSYPKLEKIYSPRQGYVNDVWVHPYHVLVGYGSNGLLASLSDYEDNATTFTYDGSLRIGQVTHPTAYDFVLDSDEFTTRSYAYELTDGAVKGTTVTDERDSDFVYVFDAGRLASIVDPLSRKVASYEWTDDNRPETIENVLGGVTTIEYDSNGNPTSIVDSLNREVVATFDSLNRLTEVTDPLGQIVEFSYDDNSDTPRLPIAMSGEGDANKVTFAWGNAGSDHLGMIDEFHDPNGNFQGVVYKGRNVSRMLDRMATSSMRGSGDCPISERDYLSGPTGEDTIRGRAFHPEGDFDEDPTNNCTPFARGDSCEYATPVECQTCGCTTQRNESGSPISLRKDGAECGYPDEYPDTEFGVGLRGGATLTCGGNPFAYDGNERLVCAHYFPSLFGGHLALNLQNASMQHDLTYDARGRLLHTQVRAEPFQTENFGVIHWTQSYPHVWSFPGYETWTDFADSSGAMRIRYQRDIEDDCGPWGCDGVKLRRFNITYETDVAGRVVEINREDIPDSAENVDPIETTTTYAYEDSTVDPAVIEARPDGSMTEYYLNLAGEVRKIVHYDEHQQVVAAFEYARDANGRITRYKEHIADSGTPDGVRDDQVIYTYGGGHLPATQLDPVSSVNGAKLQWNFLGGLAGGHALSKSDPNRLVTEFRYNDDPDDQGVAVAYKKTYYFDPGGNRLAMKVWNVTQGGHVSTPVSITRYNYWYADVHDDSTATASAPPGTPIVGDLVMNYAGRGQNKLLSTQTFFFDEEGGLLSDRVEVETFDYPLDEATGETTNDIGTRVRTLYGYYAADWHPIADETTEYEYHDGQLGLQYVTQRTGLDEPSAVEDTWAEYSTYDIFGRRISRAVCEEPGPLMTNGDCVFFSHPGAPCYTDPGNACKADTSHFDYLGLSQQVLAERKSPLVEQINESVTGTIFTFFNHDRFVATYTPGAMGNTTRMIEGGDAALAGNRFVSILADAQGAAAGVLEDTDGDPQTDLAPGWQHFDAFGVAATTRQTAAGAYAWRGMEGSESDLRPATDFNAATWGGSGWATDQDDGGLVLMQARHYDPSLGRFIQADDLPIAGLTTQGMNRYIYCGNDPANRSDSSGNYWQLIGVGLVAVGLGLQVASYYASTPFEAAVLAASGALIFAIGWTLLTPVGIIAGLQMAWAQLLKLVSLVAPSVILFVLLSLRANLDVIMRFFPGSPFWCKLQSGLNQLISRFSDSSNRSRDQFSPFDSPNVRICGPGRYNIGSTLAAKGRGPGIVRLVA